MSKTQKVDGKRALHLINLIKDLEQKVVDTNDPESLLRKNLISGIRKELDEARKALNHLNNRLDAKVLDDDSFIKHYGK